MKVSQKLSTALNLCLSSIAGVYEWETEWKPESQTERVGEKRQYDCVNYVERCKGNKTKRSTPRPSHPTSVVMCGSGIVT